MTLDSPRDFQVRNASINRFTWADGKLALMHWGEVDHLSQALDDIV
jgi:probable phosphoglycerate mutase